MKKKDNKRASPCRRLYLNGLFAHFPAPDPHPRAAGTGGQPLDTQIQLMAPSPPLVPFQTLLPFMHSASTGHGHGPGPNTVVTAYSSPPGDTHAAHAEPLRAPRPRAVGPAPPSETSAQRKAPEPANVFLEVCVVSVLRRPPQARVRMQIGAKIPSGPAPTLLPRHGRRSCCGWPRGRRRRPSTRVRPHSAGAPLSLRPTVSRVSVRCSPPASTGLPRQQKQGFLSAPCFGHPPHGP